MSKDNCKIFPLEDYFIIVDVVKPIQKGDTVRLKSGRLDKATTMKDSYSVGRIGHMGYSFLWFREGEYKVVGTIGKKVKGLPQIILSNLI